MAEPPIFAETFLDRADRHRFDPILTHQTRVDGPWHSVTWAELEDWSLRLAGGLVQWGYDPARPAVVLAGNRLESIMADLGRALLGATGLWLAPDGSPDEWNRIFRAVRPGLAVVEDQVGLYRLGLARGLTPNLKVLMLTGRPPSGFSGVVPLRPLLEAGEGRTPGFRTDILERLAQVDPDDAFGLVGDESELKTITQSDLTMILNGMESHLASGADGPRLMAAPLSGWPARAAGLYLALTRDTALALPAPGTDVLAAAARIQPDSLIAPPVWWSQTARHFLHQAAQRFIPGRLVKNTLESTALDAAAQRSWLGRAARRWVWAKWRDRLGGRLGLALSSAGDMDPETLVFWRAMECRCLALGPLSRPSAWVEREEESE